MLPRTISNTSAGSLNLTRVKNIAYPAAKRSMEKTMALISGRDQFSIIPLMAKSKSIKYETAKIILYFTELAFVLVIGFGYGRQKLMNFNGYM